MTIQVNITNDKKIIEFILSGVVNGSDIIEAHKEFHTKELLSSLRLKIIDKSKVKENNISVEDIHTISKLDNEIAIKHPDILIAMIKSNESISASTEIWSALSKHAISNINFFSSRSDVEQWICENSI